MVETVVLEIPITLAFLVSILSKSTKQSRHLSMGYCQVFLHFGH
jgi:hypothetical protein